MGKNMVLKNKEGEQVFPATTADQVSWNKNTNLKQMMAKQDARISNLAKLPSGSTKGDAELQDIRTGEDGTVYDNAGEAVRQQIGSLKESLDNVEIDIYEKSLNLFNPQTIKSNTSLINWKPQVTNNTLGNCTYKSNTQSVNGPIACKGNESYTFFKNNNDKTGVIANITPCIMFFDAEKKYISHIENVCTVITPENACYYMIAYNNNNSVVMIIKTNDSTLTKFIEFGNTLKVYNKNEIEKQKEEIRSEIRSDGKKSYVLLNFDDASTICTDGRYELVKEKYGFVFTAALGIASNGNADLKRQDIKKLLGSGCDIGIYSMYGWTNEMNPNNKNEEANWELYVKTATELSQSAGVYNPTVWMSRQNKTGTVLNNVLKKYGYKVCRGYKYDTDESVKTVINHWDKDDFNAVCIELYPNTKNTVLKQIDYAIENDCDISILTHHFYDTEDEANKNYSATKEIYIEILDRIKQYVDAGKCEVVTYRDWYRRRANNDGYNNDYERQQKNIAKINNSNILYGKKYVSCGDSYTEGDFSGYTDENGLSGKNSPVIYDTNRKMYKTYPWWIAERNNMTLVNEAKCGTTITNAFNGERNPFSVSRYLAVPTDADYITLMFGLNETGLTDEQIWTKTDTDNTTLWGAYNIVFKHFLTNMPLAKTGVIIADAWMNEKYANAVKEICKNWGIPVLDLKFDTSITAGISGRTGMNSEAISLRDKVFALSNNHPSVEAHEYRSTIIEHWLRSL